VIKPDPQVVKALALFSRQHPEVFGWLKDWEMRELRRLPSAIEHPAVFQGRCQVLGELVALITESPAIAAKL
jgi:hypothetical protein